MPDLQPIVQRISTQYDPAGLTKFIGQLGTVPGIAALAVAGVAAVAGGIALCVDKTMKWGAQLDNTIDLLGVTSKEAAGLGLIAKVTGVNIDTLTKGLNIMGKGLVDVNGKLGTSGEELKAIGISVYDANGQLKKTPAILQEVATYMSHMADGTAKTRLEMALFGRSGTEIDEVLRQAANGGMQKYIDQASKMGLALSSKQVDQVEQLGFKFGEFGMQLEGIAVTLGIVFIPAIQSAMDWLSKLVGSMYPAIQTAGQFMNVLFGGSNAPELPSGYAGGTAGGYTGSAAAIADAEWRAKNGYAARKPGDPLYAAQGTGSGGLTSSYGLPSSAIQAMTGSPWGGANFDQPWMKAIIDLKDGILKFDWGGLISGIGSVANWIMSQGQPGSLYDTARLRSPGEAYPDNTTLLGGDGSKGILQSGWDEIANWYASFEEQRTKNVTAIANTMYWIGEGIGSAVMGLVNTLIGFYNQAAAWLAKILGISIPSIGLLTSNRPNPAPVSSSGGGQYGSGGLGRAGGGFLNPGWTQVGEAGYELIGPNGRVYPHDISARLLPFVRARGLQMGGYVDYNALMGMGSGTGSDPYSFYKMQNRMQSGWSPSHGTVADIMASQGAPGWSGSGGSGGTSAQAATAQQTAQAAQAAASAVTVATAAAASISKSGANIEASSAKAAVSQAKTQDALEGIRSLLSQIRVDLNQLQMATVSEIRKG